MNAAPIVLFVYNRPEHTRKVLQSIQANALASSTKLYIYADGAPVNASTSNREKVNQVRSIIREEQWCGEVEIIESAANFGCANSIINGLNATFAKHEKAIIIEDDIIVHKDFLAYMNKALDRYAEDPGILSVTGYQYPVKFPDTVGETFFISLGSSWAWGSWRRAWELFDANAKGWEVLKTNEKLRKKFTFEYSNDFYSMMRQQMEDKTLDSWAIRWYWTSFKYHGLHLYPKHSLVENIGFDGTGIHKVDNNVNFSKMISGNYTPQFPDEINENLKATKVLIKFWKLFYHHNLATRITRRIYSIVKT